MNDKLIKQIKSEISFLKGKNIEWLVHEADIECCHEDFLPIIHRVNKLKQKLKKLNKEVK